MGGSIVLKYPVQIRLFGQVADKDGRKKVLCVIEEFSNNELTKNIISMLTFPAEG
jgi:hypothetical protein